MPSAQAIGMKITQSSTRSSKKCEAHDRDGALDRENKVVEEIVDGVKERASSLGNDRTEVVRVRDALLSPSMRCGHRGEKQSELADDAPTIVARLPLVETVPDRSESKTIWAGVTNPGGETEAQSRAESTIECSSEKREPKRAAHNFLLSLYAKTIALFGAWFPRCATGNAKEEPGKFHMRVEEIFRFDGRTIFIGEMDGESEFQKESFWWLSSPSAGFLFVGVESESLGPGLKRKRHAISTQEEMCRFISIAQGSLELLRVRES